MTSNKINIHAEYLLRRGTSNPKPNKISIIPVVITISVLKGIKLGIIMDIPFANAKCPMAVKHSMAHIAIWADNVKLYCLKISFVENAVMLKASSKTISGFIF